MKKPKRIVSDVKRLMKEWDWSENNSHGIFPNSLGAQSNTYAYWKCKYGHKWKAKINNRYNGRGCPHCRNRMRTSFPEQAVFFYVKRAFPDAINLCTTVLGDNKTELDIYIPSLKIAIEYDGLAWHTDKHLDREKRKFQLCIKNGITLLRLKENAEHFKYRKEICHGAFLVRKPSNFEYLNMAIKELLYHLGNQDFVKMYPDIFKANDSIFDITESNQIERALGLSRYRFDPFDFPIKTNVDVERDRDKIYENYLKEFIKKSLAKVYPNIAKEWHPTKNGNLKPTMFLPNSGVKVWWKCKLGHEWKIAPTVRVRGNGCPYCSGNKVLPGFNDLKTKYPKLCEEWDQEKNGSLKPEMFTYGSGKKVWWKCKNGHSYISAINNRSSNKHGCPYCSHEKPIVGENDLKTVKPELCNEWNYEKNGNLKPEQFMLQSNRIVWWKCKKCGYSYKSAIANRAVHGTGCPNCRNMILHKGVNDLKTLYPNVAKEWDYEKNYPLKPSDIFPSSNKKYHWKCKHGHTWVTTANARISNGHIRGCPYCAGNKVWQGFNDLAATHPNLVKEWHPTMNLPLKPTQISKGYSKKVWWKCPKCGKAYQSFVGNRTKGFGKCPYCTNRKTRTKLVLQVETGKTFKTLKEAAAHTPNTDYKEIQSVCAGKVKKAGGYSWKYISADSKLS